MYFMQTHTIKKMNSCITNLYLEERLVTFCFLLVCLLLLTAWARVASHVHEVTLQSPKLI